MAPATLSDWSGPSALARSAGVGLISRIAARWQDSRSVAFEQFLCFEMAVCADALLRPNHLYEFPREMRRELDHSAVVQQQTINFATWIEEILRNRW